jgi:esterase/lipase superfamily enzyme
MNGYWSRKGIWIMIMLAVVAALLAVIMSGCRLEISAQRYIDVSMLPDIDPFESMKVSAGLKSGGDYFLMPVFYATDRQETGSEDPDEFYSKDPASESKGSALSLGYCLVSIPWSHEMGEVESPCFDIDQLENPEKHILILSLTPAKSKKFFYWTLRSHIEDAYARETFVFIHGYNTSFEDAPRRTAQIAYDLNFNGLHKGPPIMYSWPSSESATGYLTDLRNIEWSQPHLIEFLLAVRKYSGADTIHLVAHSMGSELLSRALTKMKEAGLFTAEPQFNEVVLAAPDIDAEIFKRDIAPKIVGATNRLTIYASADDIALQLSREVRDDFKRLGEGGDRITTFPDIKNIDVVDASDVNTSIFGLYHAYVSDSTEIIADMRAVCQGILADADERFLLRAKDSAYWILPRKD